MDDEQPLTCRATVSEVQTFEARVVEGVNWSAHPVLARKGL